MKRIVLLATVMAMLCIAVRAAESPRGVKLVSSSDALAFLELDIENRPGWVAGIKGGYQWKLFRGAGVKLENGGTQIYSNRKNFTENGVAGSVSLGYNFAPRVPLTLGINLGFSPVGELKFHNSVNGGYLRSKQRVRVYTLDISADYDFKNCSRWTPFVGGIIGAGFVSNRVEADLSTPGGDYRGSHSKKKSTNLVTGLRTGVKFDINSRVTLTGYGSYTYLGRIKSQSFDFDGAGSNYHLKSRRINAHALDLRLGVKIRF